jgi:VanZ family protein
MPESPAPGARKHAGKRLRTRLGWIAALTYMGVIFWLSSIPGEELPLPDIQNIDKVAHFLTYAGLGVLIAFRRGIAQFLRGRHVEEWTKGGWIAPAVGIAYGMFDEIHQLYTPNRTFDLMDWLTDIVGILLGFWLARKWDARRMRNDE